MRAGGDGERKHLNRPWLKLKKSASDSKGLPFSPRLPFQDAGTPEVSYPQSKPGESNDTEEDLD